MSEASVDDKQSSRAPAREMLAALLKASQEMQRKLSDSSEYVERLNTILDAKVEERLAELNDGVEVLMRGNIQGLSTEKDAIIAELIELRQEELKLLHEVGRSLRDALNEKLAELIAAMKEQVRRMLTAFKEHLRQSENELNDSIGQLRKNLADKLPAQLDIVRQAMLKERQLIEGLEIKHEEMLSLADSDYLEQLTSQCGAFKDELEGEGNDYFLSVASIVEEITIEQEERFRARRQSLADIEQQCKNDIDADLKYLDQLPLSFAESCKRMSELHADLHGTTVSNLALVYRTEILSLAKETEDQLMIVRSHVQTVLQDHTDSYAEEVAKLLEKFEKNARESLADQTNNPANKSPDDKNALASLDKHFEKLREKCIHGAAKEFTNAETAVNKATEIFRSRLHTVRDEVSAGVEKEFVESRKELLEFSEHSKDALVELWETAES
jgi:hypothetical protein